MTMRIAAAGLVSAMALLAASAAAAGDYTVLTTGRPSGAMTVAGDGAGRTVTYSYNDRGRGPDLKETYRVGPDGLVEQVATKGVDYLKAPVDETFSRAGGKGTWSSQADSGSSDAKAFYVTYQSTPEDAAVLVRALLKAPGGKLGILPAGEARIRKVLDKAVEGPGGAKETVTLYAVEGLGLTPFPVWLDARGELFFSGATWSGTIRKGWEAAAAGVVAAQDEAFRTREREVAKTLARKPESALAITNANLFDAKAKVMRAGMTVVVRGDRIAAVGADGKVAIPAGAEVVDAKGKALLPGLWDMHVHISDNSEGPLQLAAGVTSVRDMANDIDELNARRKRFDSGELVGPRIFMAGFIDGPGPLAAPTKILASTPEEVTAFINRYADLGYEQIKLYSSLKPELVAVATKAAHARGLRVSGHIPAGMTADQAVDAGYDEIQHVNFVMLNFYPDAAKDTASMKRFQVIGDRAATFDVNAPAVQAFLRKLHDKDIVVDPTVATFEGMFTAEPRKADPSLAAALHRLPPAVARGAYGGGMAKDDAQRAQYTAAYAKMVEMVGALHKAGVRMVPGTDGFDGFLLEREFELWARAGIPNADIIYAATLGSASVNHHDKDLGSVEVGKLADIILVDGDPSKDISDLRKVSWVMKDGTVFDPKALYAAVGVR
jgi:imidazolonepropionase-like amidohydrolase